jgi:hypothetical protein
MTKIVKATHEGELTIGSITIPCYVLPDGTRVLSWSGVIKAFGGSKGGARSSEGGVHKLPRILTSNSVKPFISKELLACAENHYEFQPPHGGRTAYGYDASLLPMMCETILDAEKAGAFDRNPEPAKIAEILIRGFARVGIVALIDEATGYQDIRDRKALAAILDKYLRKEFAAWAKKFPDEFYKEIFRLRNWPWDPKSVSRPSVVGKYTNDLVYERLAPNILEELQKLNPKNESGNRAQKHHQWLTEDIGNPALAQHVYALIALMKASTSWDGFYRSVQRALPKKNEQIPLLIED